VTIVILFPYEAPDPARDRQDLIIYAEAGHAPSQRALADCYRIGDELTKQDYAEAIRWYRLAAEKGDAAAQNDLGSMHLNAMGVPKDATEAAKWYRKSAEQGLAMAMFHYALRCLHGDGVEQDDAEAVFLAK
jgi:TPR repeat protein